MPKRLVFEEQTDEKRQRKLNVNVAGNTKAVVVRMPLCLAVRRSVLGLALLFLLLFLLLGAVVGLRLGLALPLLLLFLLLLLLLGLQLLGRDKRLGPLLHLLLALLALPLHNLLLLGALLGLLGQEVLAGLDLQIHLALFRRRRERRVHLLRFVGDLVGNAALRQRTLLEVGQESVPGFVGERGILGQLALDHELLDVVDRVDVGHTVVDHPADLLQPLVRTHRRDRITLDQDVGAGEQLQRFQGGTGGTEETLSALHEALLVADLVADLDDVACDAVFEDFQGLDHGRQL